MRWWWVGGAALASVAVLLLLFLRAPSPHIQENSIMPQRRAVAASTTAISGPSWSQDRVDQRYLPLDGEYYRQGWSSGEGVDVYVLDTGIRASHVEFARNGVLPGASFVEDARDPLTDCSGHGTHVASMIAGKVCAHRTAPLPHPTPLAFAFL